MEQLDCSTCHRNEKEGLSAVTFHMFNQKGQCLLGWVLSHAKEPFFGLIRSSFTSNMARIMMNDGRKENALLFHECFRAGGVVLMT
jgi:hypothetical protein